MTNKYASLSLGTIEAVFNKLGGLEAADKFLRDELTVSEPARRFRIEGGVIYFTLPATDGTTGPQWIDRLEKKGFRLSKWSKDVLNSPAFKPTTGIVREIAVLKGMLFEDNDRTTKNVRAKADTLGFKHGKDISPEIACQIREMFTDKEIEEMGLIWITTMHEPIKDSGGALSLLDADRRDDGLWLNAYYVYPDFRWDREGGFAVVVSQVVLDPK